MPATARPRRRRVDAQRNRVTILDVAREAFAGAGGEDVSMAEVARRAGVGMATLYRNFPGRQQLLEAVFADEVDEICARATITDGSRGDGDFYEWLQTFFDFAFRRRNVAAELIREGGLGTEVFREDKRKICEAASPLLDAARVAGGYDSSLDIGQVLDGVVYIARINGDPDYVWPIFDAFVKGLRSSGIE